MAYRTLLAIAVFIGTLATPGLTQSPNGPWRQYKTPEEAGFDSTQLGQACKIAEDSRSGAVMLIYRGRVVFAWGDVERRFRCHSVRKSFMSALIGMQVEAGKIELNKTLGDLKIDDLARLTDTEKKARVVDLLRARSGVYHTAAKEPADMKTERPARGSHAPGSYWWYNNWDFNTLGTIFEMETGKKIFEEFKTGIADPIGMEDFRLRDGVYEFEPGNSRYPAYAYRMSARDFARFGQLFLHKGAWNGHQIIPASWVTESTSVQSKIGNGRGYGYMWWVYPASVFKGNPKRVQSDRYDKFSATGTGGQFILVIPEAEIVFIHRGDTDNGRNVRGRPIWEMVDLCLAARTKDPKPSPELMALQSKPFERALPGPPDRTAIELAPDSWRRHLGRYAVTPKIWFDLFEYDERLFLRTFRGGEGELFAESETKFFDTSGSVSIQMTSDGEGVTLGMILKTDGQVIPVRKITE